MAPFPFGLAVPLIISLIATFARWSDNRIATVTA